jgi:predicted DCC family thiol-disulfide oxidoreductase YuxK
VSIAWPLRVYYDRSCGLCRREMHALAEFDARGRLQLVDCSVPGFEDADLAAAGIPVAEAMRIIQARDAEGRWLRGVEVFEAAYGGVGLVGVAAMFAHPWLRPLWDRAYPWIARHRHGLTRLGLTAPYGWLVRRAARRASQRSRACADGACELRG